ncbi:MAG: ribosome silencing factor [Comamonadaceae bacterium]|nr:MAG: ribosome silencing factor [Comamonadaceae bacterium]
MTTSTKSESAAKKDVTKLQRAIVDGLEDVKAQDIQVFNTEHLSPLFERVIVASGTSNRQTKALASSVRDAVREAGFAKPRIEGEDNGEWIIVDCGAAVAHIMQPAIRQYYRLEEIWGDTPVRLKLGAPKPAEAVKKPAKKKAAAAPAQPARKPGAPKPAAKAAAAGKTAAKPAGRAGATPAAAKPAAKKAAPAKTSTRTPVKTAANTAVKTAAKTTAAKTPAKTPAKSSIQTIVVKPFVKKAPVKAAAKSSSARPAAKRAGSNASATPAAKRPAAAKKAPGRKS